MADGRDPHALRPEEDVFVKFSLDVRITNDIRRLWRHDLLKLRRTDEATAAAFATTTTGTSTGTRTGAAWLSDRGYRTADFAFEELAVLVRDGLREHVVPGATPLLAAALVEGFEGSPSTVSPTRPPGGRRICARSSPALDAFARHGVVLEAHLQNTVVAVDADGIPVQALFRDAEGVKLLTDVDRAAGWERLVYCLIVNNVSEFAALLAEGHPGWDPWAAVRTELAHHGLPGIAHEIAELLAAPRFPARRTCCFAGRARTARTPATSRCRTRWPAPSTGFLLTLPTWRPSSSTPVPALDPGGPPPPTRRPGEVNKRRRQVNVMMERFDLGGAAHTSAPASGERRYDHRRIGPLGCHGFLRCGVTPSVPCFPDRPGAWSTCDVRALTSGLGRERRIAPMANEDAVSQESGSERVVAGRYSLLSPLGAGGMGTVWRAYDKVLHREVAIKEVRAPAGLAAPDIERMYTRLEREAWAAARVAHPNVVTVYDVAMEEGRPWIVMELVRGQSLADLLKTEGRLSRNVPRPSASRCSPRSTPPTRPVCCTET